MLVLGSKMTDDQNSHKISTDYTDNVDIEYQNKLPVENKVFDLNNYRNV